MSEYEGHRARQKEKFRRMGLDALLDHEVLELLLFYAIPLRDTKPLAHRLLDRFGTLDGVFSATEGELCAVSGVGENTAVLLRMMLPLWRRTQLSAARETVLSDSERIGDFFCTLLTGERKEQLYAAAIDAKGKLLDCRRLREGDHSTVDIDFRTLVEFVIDSNASYLALAHNHPSGCAIPSARDISATHRACQVLAPLGVRLIDHVIVADGDYVSLRQSGQID